MEKILITGGTGFIGSHLIPILKENGHEVVLLSRTEQSYMGCKAFEWNIKTNFIDERAFEGVTSIIHLAGAGIADKRWTGSRKRVLIDSRVESADLLYKSVKAKNLQLNSYISASGINYYGTKTLDHTFVESDEPGNEFIAEICIEWEKAADKFKDICRVVKLRTGVVLSAEDGALRRLAQPIKYGFGAPIGSGNQYMPCIHIRDLCRMYAFAIQNRDLSGAFNAVNGQSVTNKELTKAVAKALNKSLWLPNIPGFVMKMLFGEMAVILLGGSNASGDKIKNNGFEFEFPTLEAALNDLYQ